MTIKKISKPVITTEIIDGVKYISSIYRGTEYTLYNSNGSWWCGSRRLALGRMNMGGGKYYVTLQDIVDGCKAFGNIEELIALVYNVEI